MRYVSSTHKVGDKHQDFYKVPAKGENILAKIDEPDNIVNLWMTMGSR
jgi:predicted transcriptional regulator